MNTRTEEKIWDAVEAALDSGLSPDQLVSAMRLAWHNLLREKIDRDDREFARLQK